MDWLAVVSHDLDDVRCGLPSKGTWLNIGQHWKPRERDRLSRDQPHGGVQPFSDISNMCWCEFSCFLYVSVVFFDRKLRDFLLVKQKTPVDISASFSDDPRSRSPRFSKNLPATVRLNK